MMDVILYAAGCFIAFLIIGLCASAVIAVLDLFVYTVKRFIRRLRK